MSPKRYTRLNILLFRKAFAVRGALPGAPKQADFLDRYRGAGLQFAPFPGAIAQLGERLHGMQEVDGSIPSGSTRSPALPRADWPDQRPHRLEA